MVYVAFVIDVFARKIVGWRVSTSMTTGFVLDALNQAICQRAPSGADKLIHHSDRGSQYLSIKYTERLAEAGIDTSVGSVGDSYDNALAESIIGLFKTEVINFLGPWKSVGQVEWETLKWVNWYNTERLHSAIGYVTPQEKEEAMRRHGEPEIMNTDQGSQFTFIDFIKTLKDAGIQISMDGKGEWRDNVFVERLWRTIKYEVVYLRAYDSVSAAGESLRRYLMFYNSRRPHSSLDEQTPDQAYLIPSSPIPVAA